MHRAYEFLERRARPLPPGARAPRVPVTTPLAPPRPRTLDAETRNLLRAVATRIMAGGEALQAEVLGVDGTAAAAVAYVALADELSVGELAERVGLSHSATVRVVDRLEAEGLLRRTPSRRDARRRALVLTAEGAARHGRVHERLDADLDRVLATLTTGQRVLLRRIVENVAAALADPAVCRHCSPTGCPAGACPSRRG